MKNKLLFALCAVLVMIVGIVDTFRGLFAPLFTSDFGFSMEQISLIVALSYLGSLICLLLVGPTIKKFGGQAALTLFIFVFALSTGLLYFGNRYFMLATGFFFAIGMTTTVNVCVNLMSDNFGEDKVIMYVNILFFVQMIGFIMPQFILAPYAYDGMVWKGTVLTIATVLMITGTLISRLHIEKISHGNDTQSLQKSRTPSKTSWFLITMILTFYLIGEHGTINYFMSYGTEYLKMDSSTVGNYLALFFTGMMIGRLAFSSVISKIGNVTALVVSLVLASSTFLFVYSSNMLPVIFLAGLGCAIVYPTTVAMTRLCVNTEKSATATTFAVATASIVDVLFNISYGKIITHIGFGKAIFAIPLAMIIALVFAFILFLRKGHNIV